MLRKMHCAADDDLRYPFDRTARRTTAGGNKKKRGGKAGGGGGAGRKPVGLQVVAPAPIIHYILAILLLKMFI